jgi:hypothetical protein
MALNVNSAFIFMWDKLTGVKNSLSSSITLKEDVGNKSNELNDSTSLYPSNKAVHTELSLIKNNLQTISDTIPYVKQGLGTSTKDVISQKGITDIIESITGLASKGDVENTADLPTDANVGDMYFDKETDEWKYWNGEEWVVREGNPDLSKYATKVDVDGAIFDVTGDLVNLDTTDKTSIVNAINENVGRLDGQSGSIISVQSNLSAETTARTNADAGLRKQKVDATMEQIKEIVDKIKNAKTNIYDFLEAKVFEI